MTGIQRVQAALAGEKSDCVPVVPEIIQHALEVSGAVHSAYSTDPVIMADTILQAQKKYDYDAVYVSTDNYVLAEAFGAKMKFPYDEPPQMLNHPLGEGYDSQLPQFSLKNGRMSVILKATQICRQEIGDHIFIKTNLDSAPFSAAACLRGPEEFLVDLLEEDENVFDLLQICTDSVVEYGNAAARAGAHGLAFGDSVASLISTELYRKYALPYARQAIARLHETGLPVFYHVCGNTTHILEDMVSTGADCLELDSMVSMKTAKELVGSKCALEGNIATVETLYQGTPEKVRNEACALLELFKDSGGFILSSACEIPRKSPSENVLEITKAAREYTVHN